MQPWQRTFGVFALFNLVGVPLIGRGAWAAMGALHEDQALLAAVLLSVAAAAGIFAANLALTLRARALGAPGGALLVLWVVTIGTFALTIGTGFFSPLTLVQALLR